jgi:hypothetical protein
VPQKGNNSFKNFIKFQNSKINNKFKVQNFQKITIFQKFKNFKNLKKNQNFHKKSKFQKNFNISKFQKSVNIRIVSPQGVVSLGLKPSGKTTPFRLTIMDA